MGSFHSTEILGRLGKDPEMRYTASGKAVTSMSIAVDDGYGDNKSTEWYNVVAWEKQAESCAQYLAKGREVFIQGRMKTRSWDGNDGAKHYRTELIANRVVFVGGQGQGGSGGGGEVSFDGGDIDPDEIPFS